MNQRTTLKAAMVIFGLTLLLPFCVNQIEAHDGPHQDSPQLKWPEHLYKPTPVPDRICTTLTQNPATSFSVTWRTDTSPKKTLAEIALAEKGPEFLAKVKQVVGERQTLNTNLGEALYHQVDFKDLEPKTLYVYRVGDGNHWSEWIHFRTAADEPEPFVFVYFGDAQNYIKSHWSRVVREAFADAPRAAFFLHAGDLVNSGGSDAEWGEWFYSNGFIPRSIPLIAVPGNHEMVNVRIKTNDATESDNDQVKTVRQVTPHWFATFAFPKNGPEGLKETCYYLDYQDVRIVALNSNQEPQQQAEWLEDVLSQPGPKWKIVSCHHPIYSSAEGRDNKALRELWQPIFDRHQVDVVLQGHDHTYSRTNPIKFRPGSLKELNVSTGQQQQDEGGTIYAVSVSGPKMYGLKPQSFMANWATKTQLYQVLKVDGDVLTYRAMTATGELHDEFTIKKRDGLPNELVHSRTREK